MMVCDFHRLYHLVSADYVPKQVRVPERGTDVAFIRRTVAAMVGLEARPTYDLSRDVEAYCASRLYCRRWCC